MAGTAQGVLKVYDDLSGHEVASLDVHLDGQKSIASAALSCGAGVKPLYFIYEGGGSLDFHTFTIV